MFMPLVAVMMWTRNMSSLLANADVWLLINSRVLESI